MNKSINSEIFKEINNLGLYNLKEYSEKLLTPEMNKIGFFINYKNNSEFFKKLLIEGSIDTNYTFEYLGLNINFNELRYYIGMKKVSIELDVYFHNKDKERHFKNEIIYFNNNFYIKRGVRQYIIIILLKYFDIMIKYYKDIIIERIIKIEEKNQTQTQNININRDYTILGKDNITANPIIIKPKSSSSSSILNYFIIKKGGYKKINKKDYNLLELKSMCKNNKIKNYSKLNKDDLIKLLRNHK
jgi:hypothetical protein